MAALLPHATNARTHGTEQVEQIAAAMLQWGWTNPCLIDEAGNLIAGHGRLMAAQVVWARGRSIRGTPDGEVPCVVLSGLSEAQRRALILADNRIALNAGWDDSLLRVELEALEDSGLVGLMGFDSEELARLLAPVQAALTDPDDAPPALETPVSVPGDVWVMGPHRLGCGDSTSADDVNRVLAGERPRLMVTDPPYGVEYDPGWRQAAGVGSSGAAVGKVLNDHKADWREAWALFGGDVAYVWHGALHAAAVTSSLASVRLKVRAQIVWVKTRPVLGRGDYHWQHEPALYAVREGASDGWQDRPEGDDRFAPEHALASYVVRDGKPGAYRGGRKQSTVWMIEHLKSDTGHGTQKPVECMRRPIENNSAFGDAVYEPFSGSGTTLVACTMTGRRFLGQELSPAYVDVAVLRWQAFTGQVARLGAADGPTFEEVALQRGVAPSGPLAAAVEASAAGLPPKVRVVKAKPDAKAKAAAKAKLPPQPKRKPAVRSRAAH